MKQALLDSDMLDLRNEPWMRILSHASDELPDLLAVVGRADSCLILGGTNLTESMLDAAVKSEELNTILTGLYRAQILYEEDRQYLALDLEVRKGVSTDDATVDVVYDSVVQNLGRIQNEFLADWRNIYRVWDNVRSKRILRLNFVPWPGLSQGMEKTIKHRGIAN
ncbi:MAG: hypothetical protein JO235_26385 [Chroococcidiopsidaceae cyanobacterium CP_BM_RX_35]|nr:hypothetical protein [Chroococcidiopsidaceae cyanobacterium CP_BM_RX_35]